MAEATENSTERTRRSPPLWLKMHDAGIMQIKGFFPRAWLQESGADHRTLLVRIDPADAESFDHAAIAELRLTALRGECMVYLARRWTGHSGNVSFGPSIDSFACSLQLIRRHVESARTSESEIPYVDSALPNLLDVSSYELSAFILDQARPVPPLRCLQLPYRSTKPHTIPPIDAKAEWIIPHRGKIGFLEGCLSSMKTVAAPWDRVSIGLDESYSVIHGRLVAQYPEYRFFEASPEGNGPAVVMDKLWRASTAQYILFQDSDDISCVDRRDRLISELMARDLDIVGCHEIRVDDALRQVQAVRFPDRFYPESLTPVNRHAISIPLSAIRRSTIAKAGGFSSVRRFGHDTEFLYRLATQGVRAGSLDDYLFVRRKHKDAMTAHPETGHRTAPRTELLRAWGRDFELWRKGLLSSDKASFALRHRDDYKQISLHPLTETDSPKA